MNGNANSIDYDILWSELPIPQRIVYTLGDLHCHQKYSRSFIINGNQMPVCSRDVGIFLGCNIGIALVLFVNTNLSPTRAFLNLFLKEERIKKIKNPKRFVTLILIVSSIPLVLDFLLQSFSDYESTNSIRLITGIIFGIMFSFGVMVLISSILDE